jgi:hypothetical protein
MLCVGPLLTYRFLNPLVSSEAGLRALTGVPVLVIVPRILTPQNRGYRLRRFLANVGMSLVFVAGATFSYIYLNYLR